LKSSTPSPFASIYVPTALSLYQRSSIIEDATSRFGPAISGGDSLRFREVRRSKTPSGVLVGIPKPKSVN
jgi:hypothetical protein